MAKSTIVCKVCGVSVPHRDPDAYDDRCDSCREKADLVEEVRSMINLLESAASSALRGDRRQLKNNVREALQSLTEFNRYIS